MSAHADDRPTAGPSGGDTYSYGASVRELLVQALPGYDIGEELGRGACGLVVAARHRRLVRDVAVKLLPADVALDHEIGARFLAEARVLAAMDHPHVVPVYDFVEADEVFLLIMERLTGGTVKERLVAGSITARDACAVLVAACGGLDYAHDLGVLHRDVKPQNLLLSAEGVLKVADFGIAKVLVGATGVATRTGMVLGTPSYMAPEQVQGAPLSAAADVYAAGVVFYELLCGALPFPPAEDLVRAMYQRVSEEPVPLLERAAHLPPALAAIADRALRRDPAERYGSAGELGGAVAEAAAAEWGPDWAAKTPPAQDDAGRTTALGAQLPAITSTPPSGPDRERAGEAPAGKAPRTENGTLERDRELARIATALDDAAAGCGRVVVIEGPPGIGKTRLVDEARAMAKARGFGRITAVGHDAERALAWGVIRQLVERSVLRFAPDARERILAGPAGRVLEALDRAPSDATAEEGALAPTLHALWWVAADLSAQRPLLVTIDDVQWADRSSLRFLAYLARRIDDLAIALVVATRPVEGEDVALGELTAAHSGERIAPRPLSVEGIDALLRARGAVPAPEVVRALHDASRGNPFFAGRVLAELGARECALDDPRTAEEIRQLGPATIARTLLGRLGRDARTLVQVLAIAGARDGPDMAIELADLDPPAANRALDELVSADIVTDTAEVAFTHPVLRETVLADVGRAQRTAIHAAAARYLAERAMPPDRVAAHLVLAPPGTLPDAAHWLRTAARTLLAAGDATSAAAHLRRALAEQPSDPDVAAELGEALLRAGQPDEARDRLRAAAAATAVPRERARRLATAASATFALEGPAAAAAELRGLLDAGEGAGDTPARLLLEAHLGGVCSFDPDEFRRCGPRLAAFADLPGETRDERALLAILARRGWGDVRPAAEVAALARRALDPSFVFEGAAGFGAFAGAFIALVMADDIVTVRRIIEGVELAVRGGAPRDFVVMIGCRLLMSWREGDVERTAADASAAIEALRLADRDPLMAAMHAVVARQLVLALVEMGDVEEARQALGEYHSAAARYPRSIPHHRVRHAAAVIALATGDPGRARAEAEAAGAAERSAGADSPSVPWRSVAARAAALLGDDDGARSLAAEQLRLARAWGAAGDLGAALRLSAAIDPRERVSVLREAVAVLERSPAKLELAYALHDLGVAAGAAGGREPLRRAEELARACGASVLRAQARDALAALGERTQKIVVRDAVRLTPSERRVAELAVSGRSEREIAQELFVTPKAVENHLQRVFSKLGIGGIGQLPTQLSRALATTA